VVFAYTIMNTHLLDEDVELRSEMKDCICGAKLYDTAKKRQAYFTYLRSAVKCVSSPNRVILTSAAYQRKILHPVSRGDLI
jgi:hypothetical protein